jgi:hypothetical protein
MESVQKRTVLIREHSIFYGLLPISVNQDQVVRALPANCCARHVPYFYGAFSGMTSIQSGSLGLGASGTGHVSLAVDRTHRCPRRARSRRQGWPAGDRDPFHDRPVVAQAHLPSEAGTTHLINRKNGVLQAGNHATVCLLTPSYVALRNGAMALSCADRRWKLKG